MKDFIIIANPGAGKKSYEAKLSYLKQRLEAAGYSYDVRFTPNADYADRIEKLTALFNKYSGCKGVLVIGGDGTLNEVVNAIPDYSLPIGIVSNGTGNDSVKSIHGHTNLQKQVDIIISGKTATFYVGTCNGRIFINGVGLGFDGRIVEKMLGDGKKLRGFWAYLKTVLSTIVGFREHQLKIELDDQVVEQKTFLISMAMGTTFGGGFKINPLASHHDGKIDVCLIGEIPWYLRMFYLPRLRSGGHIKLTHLIRSHKSSKINIHPCDKMVAHLDGEFIGNPPFELSVAAEPIHFFS